MGCSNSPSVESINSHKIKELHINEDNKDYKDNKIISIDRIKEPTIESIKESIKEPIKESMKEPIKESHIIIEIKNKDFKESFLDNLSSSFLTLFNDNIKYFSNQSFLEGLSYEYGLMGKIEDKDKAFKIYKDGADLKNDYLCMYRLYMIYFNDYENFKLKKDGDLGTIYLFKCFAYLPYSIINGIYFIFNKFNITYEIAVFLDDNYSDFNNFQEYVQKLNENKEKYNLTENDINLIEYVIKLYFYSSEYKGDFLKLEEGEKEGLLKYNNFCLDLIKKYDIDNTNKIRNNFKKLIEEKYFKSAYDYGRFLIVEKKYDEAKKILQLGIDNSQSFCLSLYIYLILRETELNKLLLDYNQIKNILNNMCLSICFDKLNYSSFFYAFYYLTKHSSFKEELIKDFMKYAKEIYDNFNREIEKMDEIESDIRYKINILYIFGQIIFYGILGEIKQDKEKSLTFFKKSYDLAKKNEFIYFRRKNYIYIYKWRKYLYKNNKIKKEKFDKTKNKLIRLLNRALFTEFDIYNYCKVYKDIDCENTESQNIALSLLKNTKNIEMAYNFRDYVYKEKCKIAYEKNDNNKTKK